MRYDNINLRALEPEDLEVLYRWENDTEIWTVSNTITPFSKYILKKFISNSHKSIYETGQVRLMIDLVDEQVTIGTIDIFDFDSFNKRAGIGILIASEEHKRKGYATKSIECLLNYCFNTLLLHQVYCNILSNNPESIEMFKKIGFTEAGIHKEWIRTSHGYLDQHLYQIFNPNNSTAP